MNTKRIVIAGGGGFLGGVLTRYWVEKGVSVTLLTRQATAPKGAQIAQWDGQTRGSWEQVLDGADVLINLCGASVNCRYHDENRKLLMDSRLVPTRLLGDAVKDCAHPPTVWLQASTATLYKHTFGPGWTEDGEIGSDPRAKDAFSIELAQAWEDAFYEVLPDGIRGVCMRCAMVLGAGADSNNVLHTLARLTKLGLGGKMASGKQFVSWIHETDLCRAVEWILAHGDLVGPVNLAAPTPLPNQEMMKTLRTILKRPVGLPAPSFLLEFGAWLMRTETELVIKSRRVLPGSLRDSGFEFLFPTFRSAVEDLRS